MFTCSFVLLVLQDQYPVVVKVVDNKTGKETLVFIDKPSDRDGPKTFAVLTHAMSELQQRGRKGHGRYLLSKLGLRKVGQLPPFYEMSWVITHFFER